MVAICFSSNYFLTFVNSDDGFVNSDDYIGQILSISIGNNLNLFKTFIFGLMKMNIDVKTLNFC